MPKPNVAPSKIEKTASGSAGRQRLHKLMAAAGLGSRRKCEELILEGRVEVDRQQVTQMGVQVDLATQEVRVDGDVVNVRPKLVYYLLNKPTGVVSTSYDPSQRPRVIDLVPSEQRLFNVGRLDVHSEGLILVTNDGELANLLTHPRYGVEKTYRVTVVGCPTADSLAALRQGVRFAEGVAKATSVSIHTKHKTTTVLEIVLREGRNREIRRMAAKIGHKVLALNRIALGPIRLGKLPTGGFRELTYHELNALRATSRPASQGAKKKPAKRMASDKTKSTSDKPSAVGRPPKKTTRKASQQPLRPAKKKGMGRAGVRQAVAAKKARKPQGGKRKK